MNKQVPVPVGRTDAAVQILNEVEIHVDHPNQGSLFRQHLSDDNCRKFPVTQRLQTTVPARATAKCIALRHRERVPGTLPTFVIAKHIF